MIVPHANKRPARAGVLEVRIMEIAAVYGTVVALIGWDVEVRNLFPVCITDDVPQTPVIHSLGSVFRVPDYFVDEVTQMEHELQAILFCGTFILANHSPVSVLSTLVCVLARDECKPHCSGVAIGW